MGTNSCGNFFKNLFPKKKKKETQSNQQRQRAALEWTTFEDQKKSAKINESVTGSKAGPTLRYPIALFSRGLANETASFH